MLAPEPTLATLLTVAATRDPRGIAIREQGNSTTWSGAVQRSGQMARALLDAGVVAGDRVGVHFRKSADSFLAMHAVVQQGAVAVPLDPTASAAYLCAVVVQTDCRVVLTQSACRATVTQLASSNRVETFIGIDQSDLGQASNTQAMTAAAFVDFVDLEPATPAVVEPDQPAYIITTSGSTGVPKGICHSHRSAMAYVDFKLAAYDLTARDRVSDIAPNHFDISTLALWVTPHIGATNVVVPDAVQMFPASLAKLAADEAISVWYSVPYLLTQMLSRGGLHDVDLSSIRWVLFGGEVFPNQALTDLMATLPTATFSNVYGPAEVNACTIHHLDDAPSGDTPIPIGLPVHNTTVKLVDDHGDEITGQDQQGEIWVMGPTTMLGYWNRPDLDDAAFVASEPTDAGASRWYRTGDLAWRDGDENLVFAGRLDHQVKVRGHRVELESIEAILEDAPGVENAIATVARFDDGSDVIIAGLLSDADAQDAAHHDTAHHDAIRRFAADRLPAYAIPARFYDVSERPMTGSGKLDRRALRLQLIDKHYIIIDTASEGTK